MIQYKLTIYKLGYKTEDYMPNFESALQKISHSLHLETNDFANLKIYRGSRILASLHFGFDHRGKIMMDSDSYVDQQNVLDAALAIVRRDE